VRVHEEETLIFIKETARTGMEPQVEARPATPDGLLSQQQADFRHLLQNRHHHLLTPFLQNLGYCPDNRTSTTLQNESRLCKSECVESPAAPKTPQLL
jgi:hypothetical protein